jgi:MFS family permease
MIGAAEAASAMTANRYRLRDRPLADIIDAHTGEEKTMRSTAVDTTVADALPAATGPDDRGARIGGWLVAATVAGNALEFYDFLSYSAFAVYIGKAFFPTGNAFASLLLSLATFGVGFFTRPLGGVLVGAYADRVGRRPAMVLTISLMAFGTAALVLTPGYATIGPAAPVILVLARLVQGLALGGEVGPSTAVLLECAPSLRRGIFVSWQGASQGLAIFCAGVVGIILTLALSKEQLAEWGWRVPFALGLVIVPVGLFIRRRLPETLEMPGTQGGGAVLRRLWREHRRPLVLAVMIIMSLTISTYVGNYMTTYALTVLGMPASQAMWGTVVNGAVMTVAALSGGLLSDRFGRKPVMIVGRIALMLAIYPAFSILVSVHTTGALVAVTALITLLGSISAAAALAALSEVFPNAVRSSGFAIAYAVAVSVFGGTTQFVIAWLVGITGDPMAPTYYVIFTSAISLWAMFRLPETFRLRLAPPLALGAEVA